MKLSIKLSIGVILALLLTVPLLAYEPLTVEEAEKWLESVTWEELVHFVIRWDFVEHSVPQFTPFDWTAIVMTDGTVHVKQVFPAELNGWFMMIGTPETGALHYSMQPFEIDFKELVPPEKNCKTLWWTLGAFGAGLLISGAITATLIAVTGS